MSFFDDASLVFLPSGQAGKDGKAYSMKPTNGDGDFTFSRGSNLTATRVDSNGLIAKGRENLLLQSNSFDTTWTLNSTSVTSGQSGYDGSSDAWLLESNNTGGAYISQNLTASGVQTFSVYAKEGTCNFIYFVVRGSTNIASYFDLENGTIGTAVATNIDRKIESVGGGWYRCSITLSNTDTSVRIYMADADGSTTSAVGSNIYIQDAQLEIGLTSTEYIESGASTGLAGILEDSPRFDYSNGASCPSLLLEPSRTNLIGYSEYFDGWSSSGEIIKTPNATTSTEGVTNAYKIIPPSGTATNVYIYQDAAGDSFSIFAKAREKTKLLIYSGVNGSNAYFDLSSGDVLTTLSDVATADIEEIGTDGWYRCSITWNTTSTRIRVYAVDADNSTNVTGNGSDGLFIYGAQLEEGSYPTSYIPNHSGGSVTREADSCSDAGTSSTFNDDEGVLYAEISALAEDSDSKRITISDGTLANRITIAISSNTISGFVNVNNVTEYTFFESGQDVLNPIKIAVKYKRADFALWINGTEYDVSSSGSTFSANTLNELSFDNATGVNNLYGNVKQVLYFPTALSDAELTALTS